MKILIAVALISFIGSSPVSAQQTGITRCDADMKRIPALTEPGSAYVVDQLFCDQMVSIIGFEKGYFGIKLGDRVGYVYAKYVRLQQTQEQEIEQLEIGAEETKPQSPIIPKAQSTSPSSQKIRAFITDSDSWETRGGFGGIDGIVAGTTQGGARPQTAEIMRTFGERCPSITVTLNKDNADFIVLLQHEGGKGWLQRDNKAVVFNKNGDMIFSKSTRSLGNAVQDACEAIQRDLEN